MVRLCMRDLLPCLLRTLDLNKKSDAKKTSAAAANGNKATHKNNNGSETSASTKIQLASSGSNWKKLKVSVKSYLEDIISVALHQITK